MIFHILMYYIFFQSIGCILYAMCYFKSPYDIVYERGDSVALAVISGNVNFPEETPYNQVLMSIRDSLSDNQTIII